MEQVLSVVPNASVAWRQRQAVVEPTALDAVRDCAPVDEIQDIIGQQEGLRRQDDPSLII